MDKSFESDFPYDDDELPEGHQYGEAPREWPPPRREPTPDRSADEDWPPGRREPTPDEDDPYYSGESRDDDAYADFADRIPTGLLDEEGEPVREEEAVVDEEVDVNNLFHDPQNLRVEYLGKHRMAVVDQQVDDSFLVSDPNELDAVPRLVVIDAANALHGWTPLFGGENLTVPRNEQRVDAAYILSLVRFFVSKGFECMVVAQHKYMLDKVVDNTFIMNTLKQLGLMMIMDATYDDLMLFSVAGEFDAVILSEDQFRDERARPSFHSGNTRRALDLRVSPIYPRQKEHFLPKSEWGKVSRNGHFVVDHLLRFEGSADVLRNKFFSTAARGGHRHELVVEKWMTWKRRREKVLRELDALLARMVPIMEEARKSVPEVVPRGN